MERQLLFLNMVRSLFNINGALLADALTVEDQKQFVKDPARYFINDADGPQIVAIYREVMKRQIQ